MNKDQIRNVLNLIFMIVAVVGVVIYLTDDKTKGIIVILIAMCFKMAEALRWRKLPCECLINENKIISPAAHDAGRQTSDGSGHLSTD